VAEEPEDKGCCCEHNDKRDKEQSIDSTEGFAKLLPEWYSSACNFCKKNLSGSRRDKI
jgi:hypothetical protein